MNREGSQGREKDRGWGWGRFGGFGCGGGRGTEICYVSDFDESIVIDTEQRSLTAIHKSHSAETLVNGSLLFEGVYEGRIFFGQKCEASRVEETTEQLVGWFHALTSFLD